MKQELGTTSQQGQAVMLACSVSKCFVLFSFYLGTDVCIRGWQGRQLSNKNFGGVASKFFLFCFFKHPRMPLYSQADLYSNSGKMKKWVLHTPFLTPRPLIPEGRRSKWATRLFSFLSPGCPEMLCWVTLPPSLRSPLLGEQLQEEEKRQKSNAPVHC